MSTLLETKEVSKYFGEFQALDAVSIQVPKHSIFECLEILDSRGGGGGGIMMTLLL